MKLIDSILPITFALAAALTFTACEPDADAKSSGKKKSGASSGLPVYQELKVEVREDGLAYAPGEKAPFTGDSIELHYERTPPRLAKRAPYQNGRLHGVVTTFSPGGKLKQERTYDQGKPIMLVVYHGNGQKKIQENLNAKDKGEGPIQLWHDNGVIWAEAHLDANSLFHGDEKIYDREGKLAGHYRKDRGRLAEIYFETPEERAHRISNNVHPMIPSPPTPAAPEVPAKPEEAPNPEIQGSGMP